jgi:hypothetical protein
MYEGHSNPSELPSSHSHHDYVGFNLLLALTLSNVTKSHHQKNTRANDEDGDEERFSSGQLTTNTLDEIRSLVQLVHSNFNQEHKLPFGKFYPFRIWTSNVLLSFIYYL